MLCLVLTLEAIDRCASPTLLALQRPINSSFKVLCQYMKMYLYVVGVLLLHRVAQLNIIFFLKYLVV